MSVFWVWLRFFINFIKMKFYIWKIKPRLEYIVVRYQLWMLFGFGLSRYLRSILGSHQTSNWYIEISTALLCDSLWLTWFIMWDVNIWDTNIWNIDFWNMWFELSRLNINIDIYINIDAVSRSISTTWSIFWSISTTWSIIWSFYWSTVTNTSDKMSN